MLNDLLPTYRRKGRSVSMTEGEMVKDIEDRGRALCVVRVLSCAVREQPLVHVVHDMTITVAGAR